MSHEILTKRVVSDFTSAFRKNPDIDEFGFIYCPEKMVNKSPVVVEGSKLGVESWCAKVVLPCIHKQLVCQRNSKDPHMLQSFTKVALLLNPECATFWNIRKELLQKDVLEALNELRFTNIILTSHPKSPETFVHKRWVVSYILSNKCHPWNSSNHISESIANDLQIILRTELEGSRQAASGYSSNYNAWSHRIWIVEKLAQSSTEVLQSELQESRGWVMQHVSEHSGFQYRQFLLKKLDRVECLLDEFHFIDDLLRCYPGHEAIWNHRRALFNLAKVKHRETHRGAVSLDEGHINIRPKMARLQEPQQELPRQSRVQELNQNLHHVTGHVTGPVVDHLTSLCELVKFSSEQERLQLIVRSSTGSEHTVQERYCKRYLEWLERFQT